MDDYESQCDEIRKENEEYLELFQESLEGLSAKTINRHMGNMDLFLNHYLINDDLRHMPDGTMLVGYFLGCWCIEKCGYSTPETIRSIASSLKKFYKCMVENGKVEEIDYRNMCEYIKEELPQWQRSCTAYNSGDMRAYRRIALE